MFIERPPYPYRLHIPGAIWRLDPFDKHGNPLVYITFDDGPIPEATPWILQTLQERDITATFFVVADNVHKYPHLFHLIRRGGHSVGNHTMHHLQSIHTSAHRYAADVMEAHSLVGSKLFRPPHGLLRPVHRKWLHRHGFSIVMHDLVTRDYANSVSAEKIVENVRRYTRPGSIIVFHDSLRSIHKLRTALPQVLDFLTEAGYRFRPIPMP